MTFRGIALLVVLSTAIGSSAALAQSDGNLRSSTPGASQGAAGASGEGAETRGRAACRRDARKFCANAGADQFEVVQCLRTNRARLSPACQDMLKGHGQ